MRDRVPAPGLAGRHRITPENGAEPFYGIIEVADGGVDGTELKAANFLAPETAEALGLTSDDPTPNDAFQRLAPSTPGATNWDSGNLEIVNSASWASQLTVPASFTKTVQDAFYSIQGKQCTIVLFIGCTRINDALNTQIFSITGLPKIPNAYYTLPISFGNAKGILSNISNFAAAPSNNIVAMTINNDYITNGFFPINSPITIVISGVYYFN